MGDCVAVYTLSELCTLTGRLAANWVDQIARF